MTDDDPSSGPDAELWKAVEALTPKSLDDIVRKNRDFFQIGLATSQEMGARAGKIEPGLPKNRVDDWRIIAWRRLGAQRHVDGYRSWLSLLGRSARSGRALITSEIRKIDVGGGFIQTKNSLYSLGARAEGEPPLDELLFVCATAHRWGFGKLIGALEIFY